MARPPSLLSRDELPHGAEPTAIGPFRTPGAWAVAGLLVLATLALFAGSGLPPLQRAEVYFVDVARAMAETGDWLVPRYRGEPFFDKPPLSYWLMAGAFCGLGSEPLSARLVSMLATLACLGATFGLGASLFSRRAAVAGMLVLGATPAFLTFGRLAMSDMLVTLWSTLAVWLGLAGLRCSSRAWLMPLCGLVFGLAFLTKGPIAVILPGLGLCLLGVGMRQGHARPRTAALVLGAVLASLVGLGWFALLYWRLGGAPLEHFFWRENLARFTGAAYDPDRNPLYYLGSYLFLGLPWSPLLLLAAVRLRGERVSCLVLGWFLAGVAVLTLSRGKLDYYLLPLYPVASLLVGRLFDIEWGRGVRRFVGVWLTLLGVVALACALACVRLPPILRPAQPAWIAILSTGLVSALALLLAARRAELTLTLRTVSGSTLVLLLATESLLLPRLWSSGPNPRLIEDIARERAISRELRVVACHDPARVQRDLLFRARLAVERECNLREAARSERPTLLLLHDEERSLLDEGNGLRELARYTFLPAKTLHFLAWGQPVPLHQLTLAANRAAAAH